jgi:hypothetical protein
MKLKYKMNKIEDLAREIIFSKKYIIFLCLFVAVNVYNHLLNSKKIELNKNYLIIQKNLNLIFNNIITTKIRIGIYIYSLKNGGTQRITSLLLNYFYKFNLFDLFLFTQKKKEENEYFIPQSIKRSFIKDCKMTILIKEIKKKKINILIYQFPNYNGINILNKPKNVKIIFFQHYSLFYWIYYNYTIFKSIYKAYKKSKYVISIIPIENNYLFKKWGINSILMDNFITYEYNKVIPSDLSKKSIVMIGRGKDKLKRYYLGIKAMEYIKMYIPECKMKIVSNISQIDYLKTLSKNLNLENYINFIEYSSNPEIYFKNISLHIFPTISESFGLVMCEAKIYGITTILVGLDYVYLSDGGIINVYDDTAESISIQAIKILNNTKSREKFGNEARKSMKIFNNNNLYLKWIKVILSIFNGDIHYQKLRNEDKILSQKKQMKIITNQLKLLKMRKNINFTIQQIENFTYLYFYHY